MLSGDAAHSNCLFFGFTRSGLKHTLYRTRVEHANHYSSQVEKLQIKRQMGPCYSIFSFVCFVDRCFFHLSFFFAIVLFFTDYYYPLTFLDRAHCQWEYMITPICYNFLIRLLHNKLITLQTQRHHPLD